MGQGILFSRLGRFERVGIVGALFVLIFLMRHLSINATVIDEPALGLATFYLFPVILTAAWFGPRWAACAGLFSGCLFALGDVLDQHYNDLLFPSLARGILYASIGASLGIVFRYTIEANSAKLTAQKELRQLRDLQQALVPAKIPSRVGIEAAVKYLPAQMGVGGDFYLVAEGPDESTVIVVGDVMGHGPEASKKASFVRTALLTFIPFTKDPSNLLKMANAWLYERLEDESFVTALCMVYDPHAEEIHMASAGHHPPLLLEGDSVEFEPASPLGVFSTLHCQEISVPFADGNGLLAYTDGLIEARLANGELLGVERVAKRLRACKRENPKAIIKCIEGLLSDQEVMTSKDDICLVAFKPLASRTRSKQLTTVGSRYR